MQSTMVEHLQSVSQVTSWLLAWRTLFLIIHILGVVCFAYIVAKRLVPLLRAERDLRFDQPLARLEKVLKFWLGQWKHPRYKTAGTLHILIFAGFILLAMRAFTVLIVGVSQNFVMPGLSGRAGDIYGVITDYAATVLFLCMPVALATIGKVYAGAYLLHEVTFYFLLCYRPFGIQFHVETSLFNVYFAKLD